MPKWNHAVAGLALLALAVPSLAQDLTIVSKHTRSGAPPVTASSYIASDRIRSSQGDSEFMAQYGSGQFTVINHKKKEYSVVTLQHLEAVAAQAQAQMKQMEQQMASLPPEVRQKMSGMMGGLAQAISVRKGTGGRTIAGYSCQNWIVSFGEMIKTEECVTTDVQFPVQAYDAYKGFSKVMAGMAGPMGKDMGQMFDKFKEMKGIPLASTTTVSVMGKAMVSSSEVTEVKKGPIPASAWVLPLGYKKVESPLAKAIKK